MTAREHNKLVGIFLLAHGGLQALVFILMGLIYGGIGSAMLITGRKNEEQVVGIVFIVMIAVLFVIGTCFLLPQIIGGFKLLKEKPGARTWGIIGSVIACLSFPLGTAAGVYGLWFLFGDMGKQMYLGGPSQPAFQPSPQAPPPNSWQ